MNLPSLAEPLRARSGTATGSPFSLYNFNSEGDGGAAGTIFRQLYFREALQSLVNQPRYVERIFHGYAVDSFGPVPVYPAGAAASPYERGDPYANGLSAAISLLRGGLAGRSRRRIDLCRRRALRRPGRDATRVLPPLRRRGTGCHPRGERRAGGVGRGRDPRRARSRERRGGLGRRPPLCGGGLHLGAGELGRGAR